MNQPYIIFSDISADIPPSFMKENDIRFVPMHYCVGEQDRVCSQAEDEDFLKQFYEKQRNGELTRTSQISPQTYIDVFRPILQKGQSILYLSLSSGISGTYNSSCMVSEELKEEGCPGELVCVDSLAATVGMGILLEAAVKNRENGMSLKENAKWLEENRLRVCHWFMVEDLMYLKRGGRVSAATALVGTALNIKPILKIENDGTLRNFTKARGSKSALNKLLELYKTSTEGGTGERIYVVHADNEENANYLEQELKKINPSCNISKVFLNPIIGSHTGPGLSAIVHFGKRENV